MRSGITGLLGAAGVAGVALLAAGCGGANPSVESASPAEAQSGAKSAPPATLAAACARKNPGAGPARLGDARQGSPVALVQTGAKTLAYVADEDDGLLHTIDVDSGTERAVTLLAGAPSQLLVLGDGRVAVALRDKNRVQIFEPTASADAPLEARCEVPVAAEPVGLAATPDDARLLVTSAWGRRLTALDVATMKPKFDVPVAREPRAVLVDDDGERAFVAHVVGATMSVVDLNTDKHDVREIDLRVKRNERGSTSKVRNGCQGFALAKSVEMKDEAPMPRKDGTAASVAPEKPLVKGRMPKEKAPPAPRGRVFAPMVTVDPGEVAARSTGYGNSTDTVGAEAPIVTVIDGAAERPLTKSLLADGLRHQNECLLPRAAAVSGATGSLFVTCLGIDALLELDGRSVDPMRVMRRRWSVPSGPTGVAIDDSKGRAVVWSQFDHELSVIKLGEAPEKGSAAVRVLASRKAKSDVTSEIAWGRELFHKTDDPRIASDGRACASCHPDGREDALTWSTPDGPRQTIMLAGRTTASAPFGWMGAHEDVKVHLRETFRRLGGTGLPDAEGRFDELDALVAYVSKMRAPTLEGAVLPPEQTKLAARGRDLFFENSQGCATCHVGGAGTDAAKHNVGSGSFSEKKTEFDTPSLRFISGTAPYFHDGRYATLDELLSGSDGKMGHTLQLSRQDVAALKAYLETL
jgi:DNA-binding beta-propeller fold protein YncE